MIADASAETIGTIILAAGESARLGQPKQLLPFAGATLVQSAVATAVSLDCGPVAVVLGAFAEQIRPFLERLPILVVENPGWREGMGTSLSVGLRGLLHTHPKLDALLVLLCDQPLVGADALATIITTRRTTPQPIAAAEYGGTVGVPALFDSTLFLELLALQGAAGARRVLQQHAGEVATVPLPAAAIDIDTPADLAALQRAR